MLLQVILEGLGLGVLLVMICAAGIRKGAVGMVHLYSPAVQQRCVKLGAYKPRTHPTQQPAVQSSLHSRLYCLCAGLCLWDKRCKGLRSGLLAAARHLIHYESNRPLFDRWLLGGAHERMDDPRNRGSEAVHHRKRQTEKMAFRYGGDGSHSGGAGGNYDSTVIGKTLPSAAFSTFLQRPMPK